MQVLFFSLYQVRDERVDNFLLLKTSDVRQKVCKTDHAIQVHLDPGLLIQGEEVLAGNDSTRISLPLRLSFFASSAAPLLTPEADALLAYLGPDSWTWCFSSGANENVLPSTHARILRRSVAKDGEFPHARRQRHVYR